MRTRLITRELRTGSFEAASPRRSHRRPRHGRRRGGAILLFAYRRREEGEGAPDARAFVSTVTGLEACCPVRLVTSRDNELEAVALGNLWTIPGRLTRDRRPTLRHTDRRDEPVWEG